MTLSMDDDMIYDDVTSRMARRGPGPNYHLYLHKVIMTRYYIGRRAVLHSWLGFVYTPRPPETFQNVHTKKDHNYDARTCAYA